MMEQNKFNDEDFLKNVEKAAQKGARQGSFGTGIVPMVVAAIVLIIAAVFASKLLTKKWGNFLDDAKEQFAFDNKAEEHDMVIEDDGFFGYTAADFAEAMLGDSSKLKKMEVYEVKVSDAVTITDTGLANVKIFTKTQVITYNGTAVYTVDLSDLTDHDIEYDEDKAEITLYIPHAQRENINIPSEEMEFGDTTKGWLAFGDITMQPEELSRVETEAKNRMEIKLEETKAADAADRFAKMTIWELYQPLVTSVSPEVKLNVEFK